VRDTAASILLQRFGVTVTQHEAVQGKHLKLATSASDAEARPGQRLTLSVDVTPDKRIHVYAPGIQNYIPIALSLNESAGFRSDPVSYPPSRMLHLRAIQETVPVYDRPFRVLITVALADFATLGKVVDADRNLTVEGSFRYQACNDRECFLPETVPLAWKIHILPFDRQRVPEELQRKK
jgi:hypothetical protein